jgi:hypothetical protein
MGQLKAIDAAGGTAPSDCAVAATALVGTWGSQGEILFSDFRRPGGGIRRVKAEGGTSELLVAANETAALWPHFLPDGKQFFYLGFQMDRGYQIMVGSLRGAKQKTLDARPSSRTGYALPGYVFFVAGKVRVLGPACL